MQHILIYSLQLNHIIINDVLLLCCISTQAHISLGICQMVCLLMMLKQCHKHLMYISVLPNLARSTNQSTSAAVGAVNWQGTQLQYVPFWYI